MPRFYCPVSLETGANIVLPVEAARHVQVLRLQPQSKITLFNSGNTQENGLQYRDAGEYEATITQMGRNHVTVMVGQHHQPPREARAVVHLAVGVPANDRMDWLVEKATELGVASIRPLQTERSVLRLTGERAEKKVAHWQSVATAACEQCGGNRVPVVHGMMLYGQWVHSITQQTFTKAVLSLQPDAHKLQQWKTDTIGLVSEPNIMLLSGPEGGLSPDEEAAAKQQGWAPLSLGQRIFRAETAALAALAVLVL